MNVDRRGFFGLFAAAPAAQLRLTSDPPKRVTPNTLVQPVCPKCGFVAMFMTSLDYADAPNNLAWLRVHCQNCGWDGESPRSIPVPDYRLRWE